jgi:hypothetical protein
VNTSIQHGMSAEFTVDEIFDLTKIDRWLLVKKTTFADF